MSNLQIHGFCEPSFAALREEFERNFAERGELGAAVALTIAGKPVVDLWAGLADSGTAAPWREDTLAVVFSSTKGIAATCMHVLADRGLLDFEAPVADYWPEFAASGKAAITVAMVMSHQAGLPVWQDPVPPGGVWDWGTSTAQLAREAPLWQPGTRAGYHAVTIGHIVGEILRRITGTTIGQFLRDEVARPLGADVWIGLPASEEHRLATLYLGEPSPNSPLFRKLMAEPDWFGWKMMTNAGGDVTAETVNSRARHAAELPAAGGIASARGLARLYAPLALDGSVDGIRIVSAARVPAMRAVRAASDCDAILQIPTTFTLGYSKSWGARRFGQGEFVVVGENAFGTPGLGGSIGFADSDAQMSFGYIMNRHGGGVGLNDRGQSLIDAAYRCVGFRSSDAGFWAR